MVYSVHEVEICLKCLQLRVCISDINTSIAYCTGCLFWNMRTTDPDVVEGWTCGTLRPY